MKKLILLFSAACIVLISSYCFLQWRDDQYCTPYDVYWHGHMKRIYVHYMNQNILKAGEKFPEALQESRVLKSLETIFIYYPDNCKRPAIESTRTGIVPSGEEKGTVIATVRIARSPYLEGEYAFSVTFRRLGIKNETLLDGPRGGIVFYTSKVTDHDVQLYLQAAFSRFADQNWIIPEAK